MTTDDLLTIAILLTLALVALLFPGGPGTPRRFRLHSRPSCPAPAGC